MADARLFQLLELQHGVVFGFAMDVCHVAEGNFRRRGPVDGRAGAHDLYQAFVRERLEALVDARLRDLQVLVDLLDLRLVELDQPRVYLRLVLGKPERFKRLDQGGGNFGQVDHSEDRINLNIYSSSC